MPAHLSAQQMIRYRQRTLSPADLIAACDHLAACATCRAGVSDAEHLQSAFDALGPSLHQSAASESTHLTVESLAAYAAGHLAGADLDVVSSHLEICAECDANAVGLNGAEPAAERSVKVQPRPKPSLPMRPWAKLATRWRQQPIGVLVTALAVVALVALCVSVLMLRAENQRLWAGVSSLEHQNGELRTQLSALGDLQAEVAKLRKSESSGSEIEFVVALNDAGEVVGLDKQGNLAGLRGLSPAQKTLIKTALTSGRLKTPRWFADIAGSDAALMGGGDRESFRLTSPVGTATRTNRPAFRWTPLAGATSYKVTVSDSNFKSVAVSDSISGTEWTPSLPLKRGAIYTWEVTAAKDGKEITAPAPPAPEASFRVLDSASLAELETARRENSDSHLLLGILYANAGLLDDAERELQLLANANPESSVAGKLRSSLKGLRDPKPNRP